MADTRRVAAARRPPQPTEAFVTHPTWPGATVVPVLTIPGEGGVFNIATRVLDVQGSMALIELLAVEDVPPDYVGRRYWVAVESGIPNPFAGC